MAMAVEQPRLANFLATGDREARRAAEPIDPALRALVARRDDRLLRDVGLTRQDVLGPQGFFWSEWARLREPWSL